MDKDAHNAVVFPKDGGRGAIVGTVQCPRCHHDLTIAIRHNTTVRITKPPRKKKMRLEP